MRHKPLFLLFLSMIIVGLLVTSCGTSPEPTASTAEPTEASSVDAANSQALDSSEPLRMALLPVLDVLPFFIAQENGYFDEEGISVELVPVSSALERDQLFAAGEVDGMLTDVIGPAIINAAEDPSMKIVAMSRRSYDNAPLFRLLAAPTSAVETVSGLAGQNIGISENSVIQYLGDQMLSDAGVAAEDIIYESVPSIPNRFSLMMEGNLTAAILPDPLAQAAIEAGAILVLDDSIYVEEQYSQSILSFSNQVLNENPEAVRAFLRAWYRAVDELNADSDSFRTLWLENTTVPESVQDTYTIPPFPVNEITSESVWDNVNTWLVERGIIDEPAAYTDSVDASFLPE